MGNWPWFFGRLRGKFGSALIQYSGDSIAATIPGPPPSSILALFSTSKFSVCGYRSIDRMVSSHEYCFWAAEFHVSFLSQHFYISSFCAQSFPIAFRSIPKVWHQVTSHPETEPLIFLAVPCVHAKSVSSHVCESCRVPTTRLKPKVTRRGFGFNIACANLLFVIVRHK